MSIQKSTYMNKQAALLTFFALVCLLSSSCVPRAKLVYLQRDGEPTNEERSFSVKRSKYVVQENDILDIQLRSTNLEVNQLFNQASLQLANQGAQAAQNGDAFYLSGYTVDADGDVELPILGKVTVAGKNLDQIKKELNEKLEPLFDNYFLRVQLGGIRFSALGEFNKPGKYNVLQNQLTIFEAVAQAGDLTLLASRSNIKMIRQYPDETKVHNINLLDQEVINSPLYFIQPNDVLYAEPLPQKSNGIGTNGTQTFTTVLSVVASAVTIILAIQNLN